MFRGPALTGPGPRRRTLMPALLAALLLVLGAGVVTLVRGDLPWVWAAPVAEPSQSSSPSTAPSTVPVLNRTSVLSDALSSADGDWEVSRAEDATAGCEFGDDALQVTRATPGSWRCKGPNTVQPGDLQIEVNIRLVSAGSCGTIWFRYKEPAGYQVRVCETQILMGTHKAADAVAVKTLPLATPVRVGGPATRITLTTRDGTAEVARDGEVVGSMPLTDPDITEGRVVLGLFTEPGGKNYAVAFDHVDVYELR